jgi:hypothetical protein
MKARSDSLQLLLAVRTVRVGSAEETHAPYFISSTKVICTGQKIRPC